MGDMGGAVLALLVAVAVGGYLVFRGLEAIITTII